MSIRILDPFHDVDGFGFEHKCHRCNTNFGGLIARDVVDMVVHHNCHSQYCDVCAAFHATGLNASRMYRVTGDGMDFGLRCHSHAVTFYDVAIRDGQTGIDIVLDADTVCPMSCEDCANGEDK